MYIITVHGKEKEGAYSVTDGDGEDILYLFEGEDDAMRYAMMLEDEGSPEMSRGLGDVYKRQANDTRGFHIFDTETLETTPIDNPYRMFYTIFYEDTNHQTFDTREYEDKLVKLVVRKKTDTKKFEKFVDKLYSANVADMKIVENYDFSGWYEKVDDDIETEDTLSILNKYIKESEVDLDKNRIEILIGEVYQEACELV